MRIRISCSATWNSAAPLSPELYAGTAEMAATRKEEPHAHLSYCPVAPGVAALQSECARARAPERPRTCRHWCLAVGDRPRILGSRTLRLTPPDSTKNARLKRAFPVSAPSSPLLQPQHVRQFAIVVGAFGARHRLAAMIGIPCFPLIDYQNGVPSASVRDVDHIVHKRDAVALSCKMRQ